jgi:hypothetical protein
VYRIHDETQKTPHSLSYLLDMTEFPSRRNSSQKWFDWLYKATAASLLAFPYDPLHGKPLFR